MLAKRLPPRGVALHAGVLGFFTLLTAVLTFPVALLATSYLPYNGQFDPLDATWRIAWTAHALTTKPLDLFNANIFYPYSLTYAYGDLAFTAGLLTTPVTLLSGNPVLAYNLGLLLSFVLAGYCTFLLGRHLTGSVAAGVLAGIVFAFNPFRFAHVVHLSLSTSYWTPLTLLALDLFLNSKRARYALPFGLCFALQALSAFYFAFYIAIASVLLVLYHFIRARTFPDRHTWLGLAGAVGLALALAGPFIWAYTQVHLLTGFERPATELPGYSAGLVSFLATPENNRLYGQILAGINALRPNSNEFPLFPGVVAGVLGAIGLWAGRRDRRAGYFGVLAMVAGVLSLGPQLQVVPGAPNLVDVPLPYQFLFDWVPGFASMRVPARAHMLTTLAVSVGVAVAYTHLAGRLASLLRRRPGTRLILPAFLAAVMVVEYASVPLPLFHVETGAEVPEVDRWLAEQPPGPVVNFPIVFPDSEFNALMWRQYQYFSTYNWQPLLLAHQDVRPAGTNLVWAELERFPTAYGLALLQGLGIRYLVFRTGYTAPGQVEDVEKELEQADGLAQEVALPDAIIFELAPSAEMAELRALVPSGSRVLIVEDPTGDPNPYLGVLGFALGSRAIYGSLQAWFGSPPLVPRPGLEYDFAIVAASAPAPSPAFDPIPVWKDSFASLYRRS